MSKAKRPILTVGSSPRMASSSGIFARAGNPWMSPADQRKDYPASHSRPAPILKPFHEGVLESQRNARIDKAIASLGMKGDFGRPEVGNVVDPEMDAWTKAERARPRHERGPDKPIRPADNEPSASRRMANIARQMNRDMPSGKVIKVKDTSLRHPNTHPAYSQKKETLGEIVQVPYPTGGGSELKRMPLNHRVRSMKREG